MLLIFEDYSVDRHRRELRRGRSLQRVEAPVFDLLLFLIDNRERVVSKDDLLASVWGGRTVSESTLASRINAARRVGITSIQQRTSPPYAAFDQRLRELGYVDGQGSWSYPKRELPRQKGRDHRVNVGGKRC